MSCHCAMRRKHNVRLCRRSIASKVWYAALPSALLSMLQLGPALPQLGPALKQGACLLQNPDVPQNSEVPSFSRVLAYATPPKRPRLRLLAGCSDPSLAKRVGWSSPKMRLTPRYCRRARANRRTAPCERHDRCLAPGSTPSPCGCQWHVQLSVLKDTAKARWRPRVALDFKACLNSHCHFQH